MQHPKPYRIIPLDSTDSTNQVLRRMLEQGAIDSGRMTCVTAEYQTRGKGQMGNSWESERGKNLIMSVLIPCRFIAARDQFVLSEAVSLAAARLLEPYTDGISVKWPNDIYWNDRKIAGILIENTIQGSSLRDCIAGIGLNVNQAVFRSDAPNPVSLLQILGHETDREALVREFLDTLSGLVSLLRGRGNDAREALHGEFLQRAYRREGLHPFRDREGEFLASILNIGLDGRLQLLDDSGRERSYLFKEVQFVLPGQ